MQMAIGISTALHIPKKKFFNVEKILEHFFSNVDANCFYLSKKKKKTTNKINESTFDHSIKFFF